MRKLFFFFAAIAVLQFASCGKDDDAANEVLTPGGRLCTTLAYSQNVETVLNSLTVAANNYANDPSVANCNAYRNSLNGWLDVVEDYARCTAGLNQAEVQQSLVEARTEVANFDC